MAQFLFMTLCYERTFHLLYRAILGALHGSCGNKNDGRECGGDTHPLLSRDVLVQQEIGQQNGNGRIE